MKMPYLTRFHDAKVMERVNVGLAQRLEEDRIQADYCLSADHGSWEEEVRVAVFTKTLLSVEHDVFMTCGPWFKGYKPRRRSSSEELTRCGWETRFG